MYIEGEVPYITGGNNGGNGGMWGQDGIWAILLLALLGGGFNRGGYGVGGSSGGASEFVGYELGKVATQADIASGFNNSAVLSSLNDIKLGQQQAINYNNQGFAGLNTVIMQGFHGVDNAVCTLGYQTQSGFNSLSHQLSDCCCKTQASIADLKYANEAQTCQLITNQNSNTQRIIDYLTNEKIESLRAENVALKGRISNDAQSAYILDRLSPCPRPAYVVPNPNCCYNTCGGTNTISGVL